MPKQMQLVEATEVEGIRIECETCRAVGGPDRSVAVEAPRTSR